MEPLIEQRRRLALGSLMVCFLANKDLNLLGDEPADRRSPQDGNGRDGKRRGVPPRPFKLKRLSSDTTF